MGIKKILTYIFTCIILSGCAQSTVMIGPAITLASSGNMTHAGLTFFTNKAVEKETGMDTVTYVSKKIEQQNSKNKLKREFKNLVENNFVKTRKKLILEDKSNTFN
tara:strand:- start:765 stop:1082 length:318 start_codon:yes stop_codon:yes gene_type:complete